MARKVIYWVTTGLLAALSAFAGFSYVTGNQQAVQGFAHVGYPQQLRIVLVVPRFPKLKEWAYAGFTFAWISAFVAHYLAKDGLEAYMPVLLLAFLFVSYVTRPESRQWQAKATTA